jgi:hypothetical protein
LAQIDTNWRATLGKGPLESQSKIRFGLPSVPISTIAKQFYCEKQIDFEKTIGKVTSDEELLGTDIHKDLIDSKCEAVDIDEIIESIENEAYSPCVLPLWFQVNGMTIKGIPDLIIFQNSKPVLLIELKSTSRYLNRVYKNQEVQCESYGLALEEMGFDCKDLMLAIVLVDSWVYDPLLQDDFLSPLVIDEVIASIKAGIIDGINKFEPLSVDRDYEVMWHLKMYNREGALKNINWASEYWLMKRDTSFARHYSKCRNCQYEDECPQKLEDFSVVRKEMREKYPNAYKRWSEEDDIRLKREFEEGTSIDELAKMFLRNTGAIQSRLYKLELIDDWIEAIGK